MDLISVMVWPKFTPPPPTPKYTSGCGGGCIIARVYYCYRTGGRIKLLARAASKPIPPPLKIASHLGSFTLQPHRSDTQKAHKRVLRR